MGFVVPALIFWGLVALAVWFFFFRKVAEHERKVSDAKRRDAAFDSLLLRDGEPLYCLHCQKAFPGPLDDCGCPHCRTRAFVIPARLSDDPSVRNAPITAFPDAPHETHEASVTVRSNHL